MIFKQKLLQLKLENRISTWNSMKVKVAPEAECKVDWYFFLVRENYHKYIVGMGYKNQIYKKGEVRSSKQ
jgi:hypothetical protein